MKEKEEKEEERRREEKTMEITSDESMYDEESKRGIERLHSVAIEQESCGVFLLRAVIQFMLLALPALGYGVLFSEIGYGATMFTFLRQQMVIGVAIGSGGAGLFMLFTS